MKFGMSSLLEELQYINISKNLVENLDLFKNNPKNIS